MYDVGELSIIIVSFNSRPTCERSCDVLVRAENVAEIAYLDVVPLVIVTTFSE